MIPNSHSFPSYQVFHEAMIENSVDGIYELAQTYFRVNDYAASIALCTFCLSKIDNAQRIEMHRPLILLSANLYRSGLARRVYLRPLAISLIRNREIQMLVKLRSFQYTVKHLSISEMVLIVSLILRIVLLESWGIFPKSKDVIYRRVCKLIYGFCTAVFRSINS
jgi:hypothetical protein